MLGDGGDDVIPPRTVMGQNSTKRRVISLRSAAGKHNLTGPRSDQFTDLAARILNRRIGLLAIGMNRGSVPEILQKMRLHGLKNQWIQRSGGVVVQIHLLHAGSIISSPNLSEQLPLKGQHFQGQRITLTARKAHLIYLAGLVDGRDKLHEVNKLSQPVRMTVNCAEHRKEKEL